MTPEHYYNYRSKYGRRSEDKALAIDREYERNRLEQERVNNKTWGMGCNE